MSFQTSALIVTWVALLLLALVVSGLVRQVHQLSAGTRRARQAGPRPGSPAPHLDAIAPALPALLLFLDANCRTCADVLDEAGTVAGGRGLPVHALYAGPVPGGLPASGPTIVHARQQRLFTAYDAIATPYAVLVGADGRIDRAGPVGSRSALGDLLAMEATPGG